MSIDHKEVSLPDALGTRWVLYIVCALVGVLAAMAAFTRVDIVAIAPGRLVPTGQLKTVQAVEGGRILELLVREGDRVQKDQPMIRLDPSLSKADVLALDEQAMLQQLTIDRVNAELAGKPMLVRTRYPESVVAQVEAHFQARLVAQQQAIVQEKRALERAKHDLQSAEHIVQKLKETLPLYEKSEQSFEALAQSGFISTVAANEKRRERVEKERDLQAQQSAVASARAAVEQSTAKQAQLIAAYQSQLHAEKAVAQQELSRVQAELSKHSKRVEWAELRAPTQGIAKDLSTYTVGAVVPSGAVLLTIVPDNDDLVAEIQISNEDIGLTKVGDTVRLKLLAFPFQKYGLLEGKVAHIGADSTNPTSSEAQRLGAISGPPPLTYRAVVSLTDQRFQSADGVKRSLTPGMQVSAEIHLGNRSVLDYLLSPLKAVTQQAARER